ncbi:DUF4405 domain-containing protein [Tropicimonas sp. TH_r6]|uniref:DUF4405 domain-containing protein n=1 Tax=Tropicimonas sp. TH_r6 TaxID=3082085 RepID=UPI002952E69E|nr:DUF4405 domain-containing protein [Tropicimonas sp. TH_r6]MDV7143161.1 DUF4405 domain-containing protein [Tropicimonas sp. TH_r6]
MAVSDTSYHRSAHARFSGRALAVFGVSTSSLMMLISGVILYVAPRGRVAQQIDWELLFLGREGWEGLHIAASLVFTGFVLWHLLIHLKVLSNLLGGTPAHPRGHRREAWVALGVVSFICFTALAMWPPSSWVIQGNDYFKRTYWEPASGVVGLGHQNRQGSGQISR